MATYRAGNEKGEQFKNAPVGITAGVGTAFVGLCMLMAFALTGPTAPSPGVSTGFLFLGAAGAGLGVALRK